MFFRHSKNVGKEEFRVHKELNLRHSDLFSDEPQRIYREKVLGFFKLLPQQKEKRRFSRITTLNAGYSYSNDCEFTKIIDIECCSRNKYESDFRSNENYLSSSENKLWKKSGLYGIWNHGFCDTGAVLYQLS